MHVCVEPSENEKFDPSLILTLNLELNPLDLKLTGDP